MCLLMTYQDNFPGRQLLNGIIYPQDQYGNPIYNKYGEYRVRLFYNGCGRLVDIDDRLPFKGNRLLCVSTKPETYGLALIEKAYLKLFGGYDHRGSNSTNDIYMLTGWIPQGYTFSEDKDKDRFFEKLEIGLKYIYLLYRNGDCFATISSHKDGTVLESLGLDSNHGFAIYRAVKVSGSRLLMIKNPWGDSKRVWKGNFGPDDSKWTIDFQKEVGYKPEWKDRGVFMMEYDDVLKYFTDMYI